MSVLAFITAVECDGCKRTDVFQNETEHTTFDRTWFKSGSLTLCPVCRESNDPILIDASIDEQAMQRAISKAVKKYGAESAIDRSAVRLLHSEEEVVNAG